ncbi:MAG: AgmX/PglI C-terminal domain-containing protein [Labilithrix sp.]|nr:AgmX/PglI C-terminal domain-containing protein [Labilithrix sp.]MCW5816515.1 AgmX/PglI C-terminal domain-containing protein [Labilithrix sp.]
MTEHPSAITIEGLAIGAIDDEEVVAHCAACDACAAALAREARLELALGELHAFRRASPRRSPLVLFVAPIVLAAAAAILFAIRSAPAAGPELAEMRAEPAVASAASAGNEAPPGAEDVIAKLRPQFRRCHQDGLARGEPTDGKVVLRAEIAPDGRVREALVLSNSGLSDEVAACLARALGAASFPATGDDRALVVPVAFVAKR